jgi:molybdopterin converting factor small subunit
VKVRVRLFAVARQAAERDSVELDLPEGATMGQLRRELGSQVPGLSGLLDRMMFALGTRYAGDETLIPPGADVACIPPVSGG